MSKNGQHLQFLDMFWPFLGTLEGPSCKITPYSCRVGHKLQNEYPNIKIRQELPSEISKNNPVMGQGGLSYMPMCQIVNKNVKLSKDVKCQKGKHTDYGGGSQKIINWLNEVHKYWHQFWC